MNRAIDANQPAGAQGTNGTPRPSAAAKAGMAFPLSAKILTWFLLNLVFLAIVAAFVVQGQFRFGLDSLLTGRAGERLQALSEVIVADLNGHNREDWSAVLKRFADAYSVRMAVVCNDGATVSGEIPRMPDEVRPKLAPPPDRGRGRDPVGPPREGTPEERFRGPLETRPGQPMDRRPEARPGSPEQRQPDMRVPPRPGPANDRPRDAQFGPRPGSLGDRQTDGPPREGAPLSNAVAMPGSYPKFVQRVEGAFPYWIVVRAPIFDRNAWQASPLNLVMAVPSLGSGGLLLDYTPWLWIGAGLLVCSVLFWIPLVRGITRSIKQMTGAAGEMARGRFETRLETGRRDELGRLGESLNHMSGRLEEYVTGQKRFLGDIAHELCSPLARMEMALGVLEQQSGEEQQGYVNDVREEVRHMSSLVNELLSFTKAGLRSKEIELRAVPLAELCARVIAREAQERADLAVNVDPGLKVLAEPDLLARAVANVLRNALRYAGDAGPVVLAATTRGVEVSLSITDRGPGVPQESLHRLFDPFYRPETARTREGGGTGLGLAIVKSCVEACGGSVAVKNAQPSGLEVTMTLRRVV